MREVIALRVRLDVFSNGIEVHWEERCHRVSRRALAEIEEIGLASPLLTSPSDELGPQLVAAGRLLWESTLGESGLAYDPGQPVEVEVRALHPLAKHLAAIPWECMLEPQAAKPLAYHPDFSIFRSTGPAVEKSADDEASPGLRVLVLAMEPSAGTIPSSHLPEPWAAGLDAENEVAALRAGLAHLESSGLVKFEVRGLKNPVTLAAARDALEQHQPHVLHYIGHSDTLDGLTTRFLFGDDDGTWRTVSERVFLSLLVDLESPPRLLILNSCESAGPLLSAGLPAKLQRLGLRAVIAMRSSIFNSVAVLFAEHLYRWLADGASLGFSCREGRRALRLAEPRWGHWVLPILYTSDPAARVLRIETSGATHPSSSVRVSYRPGRRSPFKGLQPYGEGDREGFPGREAEVQRTLHRLLDRRRLILWGPAGAGKTSLLRAGLCPALREAGFQPSCGSQWPALADELEKGGAGMPVALILDQAEAALEAGEGEEIFSSFLHGGSALLLVAVRDTSLISLRDLIARCGSEPFSELELEAVTRASVRGILSEIRQQHGIELEPRLVKACLADLAPQDAAAEPIFLPLLSLVLTRLYGMLLPADRPVLTLLHYDQQMGKLRGLLANHLREVLDHLGEDAAASRVLALLADETSRLPIVRSGEELIRDLPDGRAVVAELVAARLVQPLPEGRYTLSHGLVASAVLARCRGNERGASLLLQARAREELCLDLDPGRVDPERLAEIDPDVLSREELAAFLGWSLLRGGIPLEERILGVPARRLREAFALLWTSASSDLLVQAVIFAESLPAYRRGRPPLKLLPGTGGEARAHFAAEWLFHVLAHKASEDREDEKKKQPIAQLLRTVILEQPLNDPKVASLADRVDLRSGPGFKSGSFLPTSLWPGPSPLFGLFLVVAAAASSSVAWSLWPGRSLTLVQLADYLTLVAALVLSTWTAFALDALDEIFFPAGHGSHPGRLRVRLWNHVAFCLFLLLVLAFYRVGITTTIAVSGWVHGEVFASSDLWRGIAAGVQQLPHDGLAGLLTAGRHLLSSMVAPLKGLLVMWGTSMLLAVALLPIVVLLCAAQRAALRSFSSWRRAGGPFKLLEIAVVLTLSGITLPTAATLGQQLLLGFQPILWQPDFFLGWGAADFLAAALGRLASSPWAELLGGGLTLVTLVFALLGESRARREAWGRLGDDPLLEKGPASLRPLVAEGTAEALRWSCRLVGRSPRVGGPEAVWLLAGLAAGLDEVFLAQVAPEEKSALAKEALKVLGRFDLSTPGVREALEEIERRLGSSAEMERGRLERVREVLEGLRPPAENLTWNRFVLWLARVLGWRGPAPWEEGGDWIWSQASGSAKERRRALLPAAAGVTLILAILIALWHGAALALCRALALLFPLSEPFGPRLLDPWTSFAPLVRGAELASPFLLWVAVAKLIKRKPPKGEGMEP